MMRTLGVAALAAALLAGGAGAGLAQGTSAEKKVVRAVPIGDLKVVDPIWTTAYITRNHAYLVWDTLFALDANNKPQPQMVERWSVSADHLTYDFTLRDGLTWHDGAPVRAADCVASIRRWGGKDGMGQVLMSFTDTLEAVDDKSFRLKLKQPVGFVIEALGKIDSNVPFMMPERIAKTDPNAQITEVIGSGPFRFIKEEFNPGAKVVYEKFAGYKPRAEPPSQAAGGKVAKIDRVELLYQPDAGTAHNALLKGEVDLLESPSNDLLAPLEASPQITVAPNDPLGYQLFLVINHLQPPFDKLAARQALMHAVKQSEFMAAAVGDPKRWSECPAIYGCGGPNDTKAGSELLAFDLDKAKALLKAAGYDGKPIAVLDPTDNATLHGGALMLREILVRLGAAVDVLALDWSTLLQRRASKNPPAQGGWNLFVTNATITGISSPLLNTFDRNCEQAWYGWACDPRIVVLTKQWTLETDPDKRKQLTDALQRAQLESVTNIPLGQYRNVIAYRKTLKGVIPGPALFYWNIEKSS
jgi:peptide/nickel transport system substrate-binding protein